MPTPFTLVDTAGFPIDGTTTAAITSAQGNGLLKASPGRLCKILVSTTNTGIITFYDNAAGNTTGTVLFIVPTTPGTGTFYTPNQPALVGLSFNAAATSSALTVTFS